MTNQAEGNSVESLELPCGYSNCVSSAIHTFTFKDREIFLCCEHAEEVVRELCAEKVFSTVMKDVKTILN